MIALIAQALARCPGTRFVEIQRDSIREIGEAVRLPDHIGLSSQDGTPKGFSRMDSFQSAITF